MRPIQKALLSTTLCLLWMLPTGLGAVEEPRSSQRRESTGSRVRSQPSRPTSSAPKTQSPGNRGNEPRTDLRSGTWVGPGSRIAHPPGHRPPYYRPPYYHYPPWGYGWGYGYGYGYRWGYPLYWGGYWGPYWGGYWGGGYPGAMRTVIYSGELAGALDLDVSPEEAEVVVDGQLVGTCDDFDGYPDYLWLKEGSYEIEFFLEDYETRSMTIDIVAGVVRQLDFSLDEGESVMPSLEPRNPAPERDRVASQEENQEVAGSTEGQRVAARIWLQISPADASVYLDGRFLGTAEEIGRLHTGMVVDSGRHLVQVVRPGYESQEQAIVLEAGDELDVRVDLSPE